MYLAYNQRQPQQMPYKTNKWKYGGILTLHQEKITKFALRTIWKILYQTNMKITLYTHVYSKHINHNSH